MFSELSAGVTNAPYFNQAARTVACMAEVLQRANTSPKSFDNIAFYVLAPEKKNKRRCFYKVRGC